MSAAAKTSDVNRLQERLNDPEVIDGLARLLNHLEAVTFAVESVEGLMRRGEVISDSIASGVSELRNADTEPATDLLSRAPQMLKTGTKLADAATDLDVEELTRSKVLERLTNPTTLATLNQLLDKLPLIAFLLESLEGFIQRGETVADNLAEAIGELNLSEHKIDFSQIAPLMETLPKMAKAGEKLFESELMGKDFPKVIDAGVTMVDSGMMDKDIIQILGDLGKKGAETYKEVTREPIQPVGGLFATLKATKDPDVQKSLGFFFAFAKAFARHLD